MRHGFGFLRSFARAPGLSLAVVLTFAVGVGLATALFAYLAFYLWPTFEAPEPERVVQIDVGTAEEPAGYLAEREFEALADSGAFEQLAGTLHAGATATFERASQHAWGRSASPDFFELFDARPALGRLLTDEDERAEAEPVVVVGHRLWRTLLAADPGAIGRNLDLNGKPYTIVGVLPRGFQGLGFATEFVVPLALSSRLSGLVRDPAGSEKWMIAWARLPKGERALEVAQSRSAAALAALDAELPHAMDGPRVASLHVATEPYAVTLADPYYKGARYLSAAALLFLLLAAGNVSGLLFARATARDREWAMRKAMGASPARLAAAIAAELAPAVAVGLAGALVIARLVLAWIEQALVTPSGGIGTTFVVEEARVFPFRWPLAAFALAVTFVALAIAVGGPLLRIVRSSPSRVLRDESAGGGVARGRLGARRLLVVAELALAVALVVGSVLLSRTLSALARAEPGFDASGLVSATVHLSRSPAGASADLATYADLVERARRLPGVRAVTLAHVSPNTGWARASKASPADRPESTFDVSYNLVGPRYHSTLGVPILFGREIDERDRPDSLPAIVVSRTLATKIFGTENAVGRRLVVAEPMRAGDLGPEMQIVGVAADAGVTRPSEPARPWVFFAYGQKRQSWMALVLRTSEPVAALEPKLRELVSTTRADASVVDLVTSEEQLGRALHAQRINAAIAGGLASAGVATALGGLVALQLFTVSARRRELGVRAALGASASTLVTAVVRDALKLAALGATVGLAAAAATSRLVEGLLYGVEPLDPLTFVAVPLGLALAVVVSSIVPARRAGRVDPIESLRAL